MTVMEWWDGLNHANRRRVLSENGAYGAGKTSRPRKWAGLKQEDRDRAAYMYGKPIPTLLRKAGMEQCVAQYGMSRKRIKTYRLSKFLALPEEQREILVSKWRDSKEGRPIGRKDSSPRMPKYKLTSELPQYIGKKAAYNPIVTVPEKPNREYLLNARVERMMQLAFIKQRYGLTRRKADAVHVDQIMNCRSEEARRLILGVSK